MGDLFGCSDANLFQRAEPRSAVARVAGRAVTIAVVSSLAVNTCIAVAALTGPISRSFAEANARTQFASAIDRSMHARNGSATVDLVAGPAGSRR